MAAGPRCRNYVSHLALLREGCEGSAECWEREGRIACASDMYRRTGLSDRYQSSLPSRMRQGGTLPNVGWHQFQNACPACVTFRRQGATGIPTDCSSISDCPGRRSNRRAQRLGGLRAAWEMLLTWRHTTGITDGLEGALLTVSSTSRAEASSHLVVSLQTAEKLILDGAISMIPCIIDQMEDQLLPEQERTRSNVDTAQDKSSFPGNVQPKAI